MVFSLQNGSRFPGSQMLNNFGLCHEPHCGKETWFYCILLKTVFVCFNRQSIHLDSSCKLCVLWDSSDLSSVILSLFWSCPFHALFRVSQGFGQCFYSELKALFFCFLFPGIPFPFSGSCGYPKLCPQVLQDRKIIEFPIWFPPPLKAPQIISQTKTYKSRKLNMFVQFFCTTPLHNPLAFISLSSVSGNFWFPVLPKVHSWYLWYG